MLLLVSTLLYLFGVGVVFTHIIAFVKSRRSSESLGNLLVSAIGLSSLIGRLALSSLCQQPWANTIVVYILAVFLCGELLNK